MKVLVREVLGVHYLVPIGEEHPGQKPMELNETAYEIYQLLSRGKTVEEVSACLAEQYRVSPSQVQEDVMSCYNEFCSRGII
ncbi:MAG: PqqD family protein [Lachnospiraceae bacterium]|nr:PqqD family protein [Lachnospiraceae bacterium]